MKNVINLVLVAILTISNLSISAVAAKKRRPGTRPTKQQKILAVCDQAEGTYVPGELIVTLKDGAMVNQNLKLVSKKAFYKLRSLTSRNFLKQILPSSNLKIEEIYKVDIDKVENTKRQLARTQMSRKKQLALKRKLGFAQDMINSSVSRSFVVDTDKLKCAELERFANKLYKNKEVELISLNYLFEALTVATGTPNDPSFSTQTNLTQINANNAWATSTGDGVNVAVIDTGVRLNHEDLVNNIDQIQNATTDFVNNDADPGDDNGHGTHVAGIVAAAGDNNRGIVGVAPDANIVPLKVLTAEARWSDSNLNTIYNTTSSDLIRAVNLAIENGDAQVINLSIGNSVPMGNYESRDNFVFGVTIRNAISNNVTIIAAAGNENTEHVGGNFYLNNDGTVNCEDCFSYISNITGVITVAAVDANNQRAEFSNYGQNIDIAAPGVNILSTSNAGGYIRLSGTSMAAPHIAGVAALMLSVNPELTPQEIRNILVATSTEINTNQAIGNLVNAEDAVNAAQAPAAVAITSPVNNDVITGNNISVDWTPVDNATSYSYELHRVISGPSFDTSALQEGTTSGTSISLSIPSPGTYRVDVRAINAGTLAGDTTSVSFVIRSFVPKQVTISNPSPGASLTPEQLRITWFEDASASSYRVTIMGGDMASEMTTIVTGTSFVPSTMLEPGTYSLSVQAIAADGTPGPAQIINFNIMEQAPADIANLSLNLSGLNLAIDWSESANAEHYEVSITNKVTGEEVYSSSPNSNHDSYSFEEGGAFRIQVRAVNSSGSSEYISRSQNIYTPLPARTRVTILEPKPQYWVKKIDGTTYGNQEFVQDDLTVTWEHLPGAVSYRLQLFEVLSGGLHKIMDQDDIEASSFVIPQSQIPVGVYRIRLMVNDARSKDIKSARSQFHQFSIVAVSATDKPRKVTLVSPRPKRTNNFDTTPLVEWTPSPNASYYKLAISKVVAGQRTYYQRWVRVNTNSYQITQANELPQSGMQVDIRACNDDNVCTRTYESTTIAPEVDNPPEQVTGLELLDANDGVFEFNWDHQDSVLFYTLKIEILNLVNLTADGKPTVTDVYYDSYIQAEDLVNNDGTISYTLLPNKYRTIARADNRLPILRGGEEGFYRVRVKAFNSENLKDPSLTPDAGLMVVGCDAYRSNYCN